MPYTATSYTTGGTATAADLDHGETQYQEATLSFNPDLFTAFVYSGLVASKDATVLNQLDVTSGKAYLLQTDGTLRQRVLTSSTQTTATASTTYYLDLNPDGSWSWGTAHSATANYLPIASVTTDASGNISAVTDARGLNTTLLSGIAGNLTFPGSLTLSSGGSLTVGGGLTVSGASSLAGLTLSGALSGTTGSFSGAVTATAFHGNADTATTATGSAAALGSGTRGNNLTAIDDGSGHMIIRFATNPTNFGIGVQGWVNSGGFYSGEYMLIDNAGQFYIGTIRNGLTQSNRVFTGANTPSSPAVGDIWYPH